MKPLHYARFLDMQAIKRNRREEGEGCIEESELGPVERSTYVACEFNGVHAVMCVKEL